ncbi:hypothetical protein [Oceanobacillus sp. Castelsardo]|uniref:hypothetical protein n=1 Tax=Oceanobacillus sp. Castelsardo TaxID=1851204 RepID=UPI000838E8D7|nr:hypothetical protein [Oceanobacillus sp. Castelsardo]
MERVLLRPYGLYIMRKNPFLIIMELGGDNIKGLNDKIVILGEKLQVIGYEVSELGNALMPYSFFAYLFFRLLIYKWGVKYSRYNNLVKSIWYLAYGTMLLTNDLGLDVVVILIAFIEGIDLLFKYFEERRDSKNAS